MSVQTRTTAIQNEIVRLYCRFIRDGVLMDVSSQPLVEIIDTDGVTVIAEYPAIKESLGVFYVDWFIPAHMPVGQYYDRWTYQWDVNSSVEEINMVFSVSSLDSYINFVSSGLAIKTSNRALQLINDLKNDFLYEAQHQTVMWEQGMRTQQENQKARVKDYYYFTITTPYTFAERGAVYFGGGLKFTVFESINLISSSSSSSEILNHSTSSNSGTSTSSSSSSSYSSASSRSSSSSATESSSSQSLSTSSSSSSESWNQTEVVLTCVGNGIPPASGTLTKISGNGNQTLTYSNYETRKSRFSTIYSFAYKNWNMDPKPIVRINNRIVEDGYYCDYNGKIYFDRIMAPEDSVNVAYQFAYFSDEELLSFLNFGLQMMNSIPPASINYMALPNAPIAWNPGIILYAAILGLKRLIFGINWQEKMIIFGDPDQASNTQSRLEGLYQDYYESWKKFGEDVKTKRLPNIEMIVTPEYSLPGGRSRWFRYLYKAS